MNISEHAKALSMSESQLRAAAYMDIRWWLFLHDVCPNCGVDFREVHPAYNVYPHWKGQCKRKELP